MLKKVSKIAALFCMLAFAGTSFAQTEEVKEFPQYGFWSNWGVGITGSFMAQPDVNSFYGIESHGWGKGHNAGLGVLLQKEIDRGRSFRFHLNFPALANCNKNDSNFSSEWGITDSTISMDRHAAITVNYVLSLNNSFRRWDPETPWNLYVFAGAGFGLSMNQGRGGSVLCQLDGGLGYSYRVCERGTLFAEFETDILSDVPNFLHGVHHMDFLATVGYIFNLGVTATDKALLDQRALITKEALAALESENDALKKDVAAAKETEKKLKSQIDDLTNENNRVRQESLARAQRVSDSLSGVLAQLKNDQLTYYAIPFSVIYGTDAWRVSDEEMAKVKAVSRIMKDNPDVKITVVGFADYTASDDYNMKLSKKRAEEVKRIMVKKYGIDEDRISVDWKGKSVAFGDIKYALNRRVSFYRVIE